MATLTTPPTKVSAVLDSERARRNSGEGENWSTFHEAGRTIRVGDDKVHSQSSTFEAEYRPGA